MAARGYAPCGSLCTSQDCRLPALVSPLPDPLAIVTNAFLFSWDHMELYAFPLFPAIRHLLSKLWSSRGMSVILITPFWLNKEWFPDLLQATIDTPRLLSMHSGLLRQPHFHRFHDGLHVHGNYPGTPLFSGLLPESCDVPGEILTAFNGCELPMQMEMLPPMVPLGGPYCVNTF